jgi:glycosyltransferase involved in cell wall biosynthesis
MRYFDRREVEVHVACTMEEGRPEVSAKRNVANIPDITLRYTYFGPSRGSVRGVSLLNKATVGTRLAASQMGLGAYIKKHRIQVLHATEKPRDCVNAVVIGKLTGAKSVMHMHVSYGEWMQKSVKWAMHHADALIGVSDFTARTFVEAGVPAKRVHTVLNSIDFNNTRWNPLLDGCMVRRSLGIPDGAIVFGIVSRLFYYKGHTYLLDALGLIKAELPDFRLVIVGEDDPASHPSATPFSQELREQATRLGILDKLIFTKFRTDIPELMSSFDIYTMPSWEEPFGMVFVEAMAMCKPVIAWAQAGPLSIVEHGKTGLLVEPKDVKGLADAILTLTKSPALRQQMGEAGRRRVQEHFTSPRMCQDVLNVYKKILAH